MSDIELVIKIPKETYKATCNGCMLPPDVENVVNAIRNGKPLPKHHGRLGDLDALEEYFRNVRKELKASDYKSGIEFFVRDEMLLNVQQFIHLCDAIIEGSDAE